MFVTLRLHLHYVEKEELKTHTICWCVVVQKGHGGMEGGENEVKGNRMA